MVGRYFGRKSPRWLERQVGKNWMGTGREVERETLCVADTTTHSRTAVAYRWLLQCVLTLSQSGCGGGGGEGREVKRRVEGEEASALRPFWCSSGTIPGPFISAFGDFCQRRPVARVRAPYHDHGKRQGRLTTCESRHSSVWYSLFLLCVDLVRVRLTRTFHAASDQGVAGNCSEVVTQTLQNPC